MLEGAHGAKGKPMSIWEYANPKRFMQTSGVLLPWVTAAAVLCLIGRAGLGVLLHTGCRQVRLDREDHLSACARRDDGDFGLDDDAGDLADLDHPAPPCLGPFGQGGGTGGADLYADRAGDRGDLGRADVGHLVGLGSAADLVSDPGAVLSGLYRAVAGGGRP